MRRSRLTEEQVIAILLEREAGSAKADMCRKHGVGRMTLESESGLPDMEFYVFGRRLPRPIGGTDTFDDACIGER